MEADATLSARASGFAGFPYAPLMRTSSAIPSRGFDGVRVFFLQIGEIIQKKLKIFSPEVLPNAKKCAIMNISE